MKRKASISVAVILLIAAVTVVYGGYMNDGFESYAVDANFTTAANGWHSTNTNVVVTSAEHAFGAQSLHLPDDSSISNSAAIANPTKLWTEYYIRPVLGVAPSSVDTNTAAFYSYVNTNGYMVMATQSGWVTNSQDLGSASITPMSSTNWSRVDIFTDWTVGTKTFALFIDGRVVCEQTDFPGTTSSSYKNFMVQNNGNSAYLDNVLITNTIPAGMTNDVNADGIADAFSIHNYGSITPPPNGIIFKFK